MHTDRFAQASDRIAARVIELRETHRVTREALAEAARSHGAPASFTAAAVRYIETGRPGADGRRRRDVTVDELLWLSAALEVSPLELIDDELAPLFSVAVSAPAAARECSRCASRQAGVESAVRDDVEELGDLAGIEPSLAATAYRLAQAIDDGGGEEGRLLPALAKELRSTLKAMTEGRTGDGGDDDDDLGAPD